MGFEFPTIPSTPFDELSPTSSPDRSSINKTTAAGQDDESLISCEREVQEAIVRRLEAQVKTLEMQVEMKDHELQKIREAHSQGISRDLSNATSLIQSSSPGTAFGTASDTASVTSLGERNCASASA